MEHGNPSVDEKLNGIYQHINQLEDRLRDLEDRVLGAEGIHARSSAERSFRNEDIDSGMAPSDSGSRHADGPGTVTLIGQTMLILGGAFLLRWATETGLLPNTIGTAAGIAYAGLWIALADRAAKAGRRSHSGFRGLAAALIGFPLIWEATVKFGFLPAAAAIPVLLGMIGCGLFVAWRRGLRALAWTVTAGAFPTTVALAFATRLYTPFIALLLLLGLATLWLGYLRKWFALAWTVALGINFTVLLLALLRLSNPPPDFVADLSPISLVSLLLLLIVVYFGSFAVRTLLRARNANILEIGQAITVFAIGLGGAIAVVRSTGSSSVPLGLASLALAAGGYGISFAFIDRRLGRGRSFLFYTSLALILALFALRVLLSGSTLTLALAAAAVLAAWVGGWKERATLSLHGAVYTVAAALAAGLFPTTTEAMFGELAGTLSTISPALLAVTAAAAACCLFPVSDQGSPLGRVSRFPKLAELIVVIAGINTVIVLLVSSWMGGSEGISPDRAGLAALRTGVLALSAVLAAWAGRSRLLFAAGWLVYPLLIAGGLKLVLEDLRTGRSSTLILSLGLFGLALVLAPRLGRRGPTLPEPATGTT